MPIDTIVGNEFMGFEDLSSEPIEVRLVGETTKCRSCDWFWQPAPYGPYPSFDFNKAYPEVFLERTNKQFRDKDLARSVPGISRGQAIAQPQILHGCRKSPVMTIGINPNLTGFWPGPDGSRWAYPLFSSFARYAYYYRHRTTHQESFSIEFIRKHIREDEAIRAKQAGYLKSARRENAARNMTFKLVYEDGSQDEIIQRWDPERPFVLLFGPEQSFKSGEVIGGYMDLPNGVELPVQQNVVGYYQRVIPILEQVSGWLRSQRNLPNLEMAEDVCQLDMVACASPGWGAQFEINKAQVVENCVNKNAWVVKQLIQSNPKVIVFSGESAFQMFNLMFERFITPKLWDKMEVYGLLKMTARDPHYLDIQTEVDGRAYRLRARIIISPHFSYDDNFEPHVRLSPDELQEFIGKFPDAYAELRAADRVIAPKAKGDGYTAIVTKGLRDWTEKYPVAAIPLMQELYDPSTLIGQGITQEILLGNLQYDSTNNHFKRSEGPCKFCVNSQWQFPEKCAYGKPDEPELPAGFLEKVVEHVIGSLSVPAPSIAPLP
ncbi:MAG TPA: hypothetical protein VN643_04790 [Pyrinomonadaceae bacterium]|nr:hypothetical protein [Pyrinomonadaceae bacterium]